LSWYNEQILKIKHDIRLQENKSESDFVGQFKYNELFARPKSLREYVDISRKYHLISIHGMQTFGLQNEDEAIRFRDLIDILYIRNINILLCFDKHLPELSEVFSNELMQKREFIRCYSRLKEMSSINYITSEDKFVKRFWYDNSRDFFAKI
jgi:predicted ATPase